MIDQSQMSDRRASVERNTRETRIALELNLDGQGNADLDCGLPFLEHMLDQIARQGMLDVAIEALGDLEIDAHHTVVDIGITLGQALDQALGQRAGIGRYGYAYVPLDEALSRVVLDFSGRPSLIYQIDWPRARVGEFDVDLIGEFFQGLCNHAGMTLHVDNLRGGNAHHIAEPVFKAFGRALRMAVARDARLGATVPSSKGSL